LDKKWVFLISINEYIWFWTCTSNCLIAILKIRGPRSLLGIFYIQSSLVFQIIVFFVRRNLPLDLDFFLEVFHPFSAFHHLIRVSLKSSVTSKFILSWSHLLCNSRALSLIWISELSSLFGKSSVSFIGLGPNT
jgi:hypothetical protein